MHPTFSKAHTLFISALVASTRPYPIWAFENVFNEQHTPQPAMLQGSLRRTTVYAVL